VADSTHQPSVTELLHALCAAGHHPDRVTVSDIVEAIGDDAFGPLLLVPALIIVSPASAVPGLSSAGGLIMVMISAQMVFGRQSLWLPAFLTSRSIARDKLAKAVSFLRRPARLIDRVTRKRLSFLTAGPLRRLPPLICMLAALMIPFFELVPMSSSIISGAIVLFALAILTRDGLLLLLGLGVLSLLGFLVLSVVS
jgi:hypothetical protein